MYSLKKLAEEVEKKREAVNSKLREKYEYARKSGFTSAESVLLQRKSWDLIKGLALELADKNESEVS